MFFCPFLSKISAYFSDNLVYHYLLENGCCETAKLLVKEKGKHTNQIKWFEDIVNSPDGIALVDRGQQIKIRQ